MSDGVHNPVQPLTPDQVRQAEANAGKEGYARRLPVALDIAIDEAAGGPMDETISSRMSRWAVMGGVRGVIGRGMCRFLNIFSKDHGPHAQVGDLTRARNEVVREEESLRKLGDGA